MVVFWGTALQLASVGGLWGMEICGVGSFFKMIFIDETQEASRNLLAEAEEMRTAFCFKVFFFSEEIAAAGQLGFSFSQKSKAKKNSNRESTTRNEQKRNRPKIISPKYHNIGKRKMNKNRGAEFFFDQPNANRKRLLPKICKNPWDGRRAWRRCLDWN